MSVLSGGDPFIEQICHRGQLPAAASSRSHGLSQYCRGWKTELVTVSQQLFSL